jgi:hypothetical protein
MGSFLRFFSGFFRSWKWLTTKNQDGNSVTLVQIYTHAEKLWHKLPGELNATLVFSQLYVVMVSCVG